MPKRQAVDATKPVGKDEEAWFQEKAEQLSLDAEEASGTDDEEGGDRGSEDSGDFDSADASPVDSDFEGDSEAEGDDEASSSDSEPDPELVEALIEATREEQQQEVGQTAEVAAREPEEPGKATNDPGSDSSEDERPNVNTVGNVPLEWYKHEEHIGYDIEGQKLIKQKRRDQLDALLARNDSAKEWRTIYDEYNDREIVLTNEEIRALWRIREGRFPHSEIDPFEPAEQWYTKNVDVHPIINAPEPKRRFIPSRWEEKRVVKLVRAIRRGLLKPRPAEKPEIEAYLLWGDEGVGNNKTPTGLAFIPAPKQQLPGHEQSFNPPKEYLPTQEELLQWELQDEEDRPAFVPRAYPALRSVPAFTAGLLKECFERCLDLYLCPRKRRKRIELDPQQLLPKLPKPRDLQPFPTTLLRRYEGHTAKVLCVAPDPSGQWLATGSADGSMRLWEVGTARCMRTWRLGHPVRCVAWCPAPGMRLLAATAGSSLLLVPAGVGDAETTAATQQALAGPPAAEQPAGSGKPLARWQPWQEGDSEGLELVHNFSLGSVTWHARGDYFATVAPTGNTQAVLVHQLSRRVTQAPFRKPRGTVVRVAFHPAKPFLFLATHNHVRVYNLAKQQLAKKLIGSGRITCLAVHPSGDHVIVGSEDKRLSWFDLDLSTKPYRSLRYHEHALRDVAFHGRYPLLASASDDATVHVFHGMVYQDLLTNPLIVPVKILRPNSVINHKGVMSCAFHPRQPWIFTAGADGAASLYSH